jgi:hypothetical protein
MSRLLARLYGSLSTGGWYSMFEVHIVRHCFDLLSDKTSPRFWLEAIISDKEKMRAYRVRRVIQGYLWFPHASLEQTCKNNVLETVSETTVN